MDAQVERRFAMGPFSSDDSLRSLMIDPAPVEVGSESWELAPHATLATGAGRWLCTASPALRDQAASLLGDVYTLVTIDCWNAFSEGATVARFRIEHRRGDQVEVEHADRRYPDLARAGALPAITATWLAERVRGLTSVRTTGGPTKKELEQRARAEAFLTELVERGVIELAPDSTITHLADRTRRILFAIARTRSDAVTGLQRMLDDTKHVARRSPDHAARAIAIRDALDSIRYRK